MTTMVDHVIAREVHYGDLLIDPYREQNLQPASYDLTLGDEFTVGRVRAHEVQSLADGACERQTSKLDEIVIGPGQFVLGHTRETIGLPPDISAEVKGRSSLGRMGLIPHTAGWIDPGFTGQITLEFVNHSRCPVKLEPGDRVAQIVFDRTDGSASEPYGEKDDQQYQGQLGVEQFSGRSDG